MEESETSTTNGRMFICKMPNLQTIMLQCKYVCYRQFSQGSLCLLQKAEKQATKNKTSKRKHNICLRNIHLFLCASVLGNAAKLGSFSERVFSYLYSVLSPRSFFIWQIVICNIVSFCDI